MADEITSDDILKENTETNGIDYQTLLDNQKTLIDMINKNSETINTLATELKGYKDLNAKLIANGFTIKQDATVNEQTNATNNMEFDFKDYKEMNLWDKPTR